MAAGVELATVGSWLVTAAGFALVLIGGFFLAGRPALLPEDLRFMGVTREHLDQAVPTLARWLRRVFWVLGGYIATTGLLVMYLARTELRTGNPSALAVLVLAGVTSAGWMTAVNFLLRSDFRWALLALDGVWVLGLGLAVGAR